MDLAKTQALVDKIEANVQTVIFGKDLQIRQLLCCWLAGGHALIEDVPGTGKTLLARALAQSVDMKLGRVQFTPDLLPSDITGHTIYLKEENRFEFHPGPLFTGVFLGDEINRATPRTQSALLESMAEGQITVDGKTYPLDPLFFAIATQNPVDQLGTFQLPEAQRDRFMMEISMGYPEPELELKMLKSQNYSHPIESLQKVVTREDISWLKSLVPEVLISDEMFQYIIELVSKTRSSREFKLGVSPRASISLSKASQAMALLDGSDYVKPAHVYHLCKPILGHRLSLSPEARLTDSTSEAALSKIMTQVFPPIG